MRGELLEVELAKTDRFHVCVSFKEASRSLLVCAIGYLDQAADFLPLRSFIENHPSKIARLDLDLGQVSFMNSSGVRGWASFVKWAEGAYQIEFSNMSSVFISQLNLYKVICGKGNWPFRQFMAPFRCSPCDKRMMFNLQFKEVVVKPGNDGVSLPVVKCEKCGKPTRFDEDPRDYFTFLFRRL